MEIAKGIKPTPSLAAVRQPVGEVLRTDDDLDAFCLEHFPMVHREFTNGMKRTLKVSLLLQMQSHDLSRVATLLVAIAPSASHLLHDEAAVHSVEPSDNPRASQDRRWIWPSVTLALGILIPTAAYLIQRAVPPPFIQPAVVPNPVVLPATVPFKLWITTDPSGAAVLLMPKRQILGYTPLSLGRSQAEGIRCIRLERTGYWGREVAIADDNRETAPSPIIEKLTPITDDTVPPELPLAASPCAK